MTVDKRLFSLPRCRFLEFTQRSPFGGALGGALRDIQKTASRETSVCYDGYMVDGIQVSQ